jgi:hypothetical protein
MTDQATVQAIRPKHGLSMRSCMVHEKIKALTKSNTIIGDEVRMSKEYAMELIVSVCKSVF